MGAAKRRKAEIDKLKALPPEEQARLRQLRHDQKLVGQGMGFNDPEQDQIAAMARLLVAEFEKAKNQKSIDPVVDFLYSRVEETVSGVEGELSKLNVAELACKKGCSHCCHIWVSVFAPEVLFVAKILKHRDQASIERVMAANTFTRNYNFHDRYYHPHPCPLLEDNVCSIYEHSPRACRLAASFDAAKCERSYINGTKENIPTSKFHMNTRYSYDLAFSMALKNLGFSSAMYEFNSALARALELEDAEARWLAGEDIFSNVICDPVDIFSTKGHL